MAKEKLKKIEGGIQIDTGPNVSTIKITSPEAALSPLKIIELIMVSARMVADHNEVPAQIVAELFLNLYQDHLAVLAKHFDLIAPVGEPSKIN